MRRQSYKVTILTAIKLINEFQQILDVGYDPQYLYRNIAILYQTLERYDESEKTLLEMTEKYPKEYKGHLQLALLYAERETKTSGRT